MRIGVPKEIKNNEYRVALTPESVVELVAEGHEIYVESGAGNGINCNDGSYLEAGAKVLANAPSVFEAAELIVKVKEPELSECSFLRSDHVLFTYLHLAALPALSERLLTIGVTAIAYETVRDEQDGGLPLLAPMSEVAGRLSIQAGARCLERANGGAGVLLGGVPGVAPANVLIIGGGVVGTNAAQMALGQRSRVSIVDQSLDRLRALDALFDGRVRTIHANRSATAAAARESDLIVGAVLVAGARAPKLLSEAVIKTLQPGTVLVDVAIDQGGCFATSRPTSHAEPSYILHDVVHYCVTNMPGVVPRTSTYALNNASLPYIKRLAKAGVRQALLSDAGFCAGLNLADGKVIHRAVADALGPEHEVVNAESVL